MGSWGMGIAQSDEYCEVYERFMDEYDEGKPLSDIKKDILEEYLEEFDENDGVLHDVYFAIGKAEWMCGGISDDILERVSRIIATGENISFFRELEVSQSNLKQRQKNLENFLSALTVPRGKTKKRRIPTEKYVEKKKAKLPAFRCGDIFSYDVDGKYRLFCLINRKQIYAVNAAYCYLWTQLYEQVPSIAQMSEEDILPLGYFTPETFPKREKLTLVGNEPQMLKLDMTFPSILCEKWSRADWAVAKEAHLSENFPSELGVRLSSCIERIQNLGHADD